MSRKYHTHIKCYECSEEIEVETVIENCVVSYPPKKWLEFKCPKCSGYSHIEVSRGHIATGLIDGGPGPCFRDETIYDIKGLDPKISNRGIWLTYGNVSKFTRPR